MDKKVIILTVIIVTALVLFLLFFKLTGNLILEQDEFSLINSSHWTHMPLTYSVSGCNNSERIYTALNQLESATNNTVSFLEVTDNPDIKITCSSLNNCYQKTTRRWWFWIITTESTCNHESGTSKITKMKGNKILNADVNIIEVTGEEDNCTSTEIHEILHAFDYQHSNVTGVLMSPEMSPGNCNETIDQSIVQDLITKYKTN